MSATVRHECCTGDYHNWSHSLTLLSAVEAVWAVIISLNTGKDSVSFRTRQTYENSQNEELCDANLEVNIPVDDFARSITRVNISHQVSTCESTRSGDQSALAEHPLFHTQISFNDRVESVASHDQECPLVVILETTSTKFTIHFEYRMQYFNSLEVEALSESLSRGLSIVTSTPQILLDDIELISSKQKQQLLRRNAAYPEAISQTVHTTVSQRAAEFPHSHAICSTNTVITYAELEEMSSKFAVVLTNAGVGRECIVPVCSPKSPWAIIAMLSIVKTGAAFTIISPEYSQDRMDHIIDTVDATVAIVTQDTSAKIKTAQKILISPEMFTSLINAVPASSLPNSCPTDTFSVCFTSGTTGMPKGMKWDHLGVVTNMLAIMQFHGLNRYSRIFQYSAYNWDASMRDIFGTLMIGACICVPTDVERSDLLAETITQLRATFLATTPTVIRMLDPNAVPTLRRLSAGGEKVTQDIVDTWSKTLVLNNCYGPAEFIVNSSINCIRPNSGVPSNIGFPLKTCLAWVVNPRNAQVLIPPGAIGELILQGPALTQGYLKSNVQTNSAFIPRLAWQNEVNLSDNQRRAYKTGDLVRLNFDGSCDYIGRKDSQIKINGQRTEISEIEVQIQSAATLSKPAHVALITPIDRPSRRILTAFIECKPSDKTVSKFGERRLILPISESFAVLASNIRSAASKVLPAYMVPTLYIPISYTPAASTGKTDRRQLTSSLAAYTWRELSIFLGTLEVAEITTPAERLLQQLWSSVLDIRDLASINGASHFIQYGGDSVAAIRLSNAARKLGLSVSTQLIMQHPRLSEMAALATSGLETLQPRLTTPFSMVPKALTDTEFLKMIADRIRVEVAQIQDMYPCTPLQEGLIASTARVATTYVSQQVFELPENLNIGGFKRAWETAYSRTPILRSRMLSVETGDSSRLYQVVVEEEIMWEISNDLDDYLTTDKSRGIAMDEKLCRFSMVTENQRSYFVWTAHHAVYDAVSLSLLLHDVAKLYIGEVPVMRPSFNTFVQSLETQDISMSREFWERYLRDYADVESFLQIPAQEPSPFASETITHSFAINRTIEEKVTLSTQLRVAFAILMGRYTASQDVVFGCTQSGRMADYADVDQLLAPVFATVPVRTKYDDAQTVYSLLEMAQADAHEILLYEQVGLQSLRQFNSSCEEACNFKSILIVQATLPDKPFPFRVQHHVQNDEFLSYPLAFECRDHQDLITVEAHFDPKIIGRQVVSRMVAEFDLLLTQVIQYPERSIGSLVVMSEDERQHLLEWNKDGHQSVDTCIHHVIAEQAANFPDRVAMQEDGLQLTYSDVERIAYNIASTLRTAGVGPEILVPIVFEKSVCAAVCMLAVLIAGGVCVAIDPSLPGTRLDEIFQATRSVVIISSTSQAHRLDQNAHTIISIDPREFEKDYNSYTTVDSGVEPHNAAFVVFTSGSTGKPKGIVLEHRNICTTSRTMHRLQSLDRDSRVLQFSSYTYDVYIEEIFITLMYGGCVCIPSEDQRRGDLSGFIRRHLVNWVDLTPTVAAMLSPDEVPSIQTVVIGGEKLSQEVFDRWVRRVNFVFTYGPAECSIICTSTDKLTAGADITKVGRPCAGSVWIVQDYDYNKLAPIGCVGEILIGGPIVGRKYLNNSAASDQSFVSSPRWALQNGLPKAQRFYRTGDLGKFNEDGTISVLGRRDLQIKISGQRIELGEIEAAVLKASPSGSQSVVEAVACLPHLETKQLAVFISLSDIPQNTGKAVRVLRYSDDLRLLFSAMQVELAGVLPRHMVPRLFVLVNHLPHTIGGKTDRRFLRELAHAFTTEDCLAFSLVSTSKAVPTNTKEKVLAALWSKLLKLDLTAIGTQDNFFQLGGTSITAMYLISTARTAGMELTIGNVFGFPTLSAMASKMRACRHTKPSTPILRFSLIPHDKRDLVCATAQSQFGYAMDQIEDLYPCTPLQANLITSTIRDPSSYVSKEIYKLPSQIQLHRLQQAWEQVVRQQLILRTCIIPVTFANDSIEMYQVVLRQCSSWSTSSASLKQYIDCSQTEHMSVGTSLCRATLVGNSASERYLIFTIHHAIFDGWSRTMMFNAIGAAYLDTAFPPVQNFDIFVKHLLESDKSTDASFWKHRLQGFKPNAFLVPPTPEYKICATSFAEREFPHRWDPAADPSIALSTILQAAWSLVLSSHCDSNDIVFGTISTGRSAQIEGIELIAGPTITTFPQRIQIPSDQVVDDFLAKVQTDLLETLEHEQFGIDSISRLSTECQHASKFRSLFVLQPQDDSIHGLTTLGLQHCPHHNVGFLSVPLTIQCTPQNEKVSIKAAYDGSLVPKPLVEQLIGQLIHVTSQLIARSRTTTLKDLCLLDSGDVARLRTWNEYSLEVSESSIPDAISSLALQCPNAEAVCGWDGSLTYAQLDRLSGQLACALSCSYGVRPKAMVPFCMPKSVWTVVIMLAILKAGGATVALDPSFPRPRIETLIQATDAKLIVVHQQFASQFSDISANVLFVDESIIKKTCQAQTEFKSVASADMTAFVLFSSGTTGIPKGIVLQHRAIMASSRGQARVLNAQPGRRVLQFAAYTFDVSVSDIFTTLLNEGCVCVPSDSQRLDDLKEAITSMRVDSTFLTPTVAKLLRPSDVPCLKSLILGGEVMSAELITTWAGAVNLFNGYGPAEAGIACTARQIRDGIAMEPSNIGMSLQSVRCWVTSAEDSDQLVPVGVIGELLLEGPSLALEYLNDPERTSKAFISTVRWMENSTVVKDHRWGFYRSGDLVRQNEDGSLTYIGRKDTQVKFHGQRLELDDIQRQIETAMDSKFEVIVDVTRPKSRQDAELLTAFIAPRRSIPYTNIPPVVREVGTDFVEKVTAAKELVRKILPPYAIPSLWVPVTSLPTSLSQKIDRTKLKELTAMLSPEVLAQCSAAARQRRPPATEKELMLAHMWAQLLKLNDDFIGLDDNFFDIGGDSIAAIRLASVTRRHNMTLPVTTVFRYPTLLAMAEAMSEAPPTLKSKQNAEVLPFQLLNLSESLLEQYLTKISQDWNLKRADIIDVYPCTTLQEGMFVSTMSQHSLYMAQFAFEVVDGTDMDKFRAAWTRVVDILPVLRARIVPGPTYENSSSGTCQIVVDEPVPWHVYDDCDIKTILDQEMPTHVDYGSALIRFAISQGATRFFVLTMHHALYDGWSLSKLFTLFDDFYHERSVENPPSYANFIAEVLSIPDAQSREFWTRTLAGAEAVNFPKIKDPTHSPRVDHIVGRNVELPAMQCSGILPSTILQAAWATVLGAHANTNDVVYHSTLSGRSSNVEDIESIVGCTIMTVPVRVIFEQKLPMAIQLRQLQIQMNELAKYGQYGLQNIRRLGEGPANAARVLSLLNIQSQDEKLYCIPQLRALARDDTDSFLNYPLTLECALGTNVCQVRLGCDTTIVSADVADRIFDQFVHVLKRFYGLTKESQLSELDLLCPQDLEMMHEWNAQPPARETKTVIQNFEVTAATYPENLAIDAWDIQMTYRQLDQLTNRLASQLLAQGVKFQQIIPLIFEKSGWAIVAMLAATKAGCAYVCFDVSAPKNRCLEICRTTGAPLVLASKQQSGFWRDHLKVLIIDNDHFQSPGEIGPVSPTVSVSDLLYVVFTSGSTGKPKGCLIEHGNFMAGLKSVKARSTIGPQDRMLQFASYSFDVSVIEIHHALLSGACLCIPRQEHCSEDLGGVMSSHKITWSYLTASVSRVLEPSEVPDLKNLCLAGEQVMPNDIKRWSSDVNIHIGYGPSECSVASTFKNNVQFNNDPSNLGLAAGCALWVVDADNHNRLCPIGVIGELLVDGPNVGRGYLNDPQRTSQSFLTKTDWLYEATGRQEARMYKTGDLAKCNPDRTITIIGRKDNQVKIRGQRMELGEPEHHLLDNPSVSHAVVLKGQTRSSLQTTLIAVLTLHGAPLTSRGSADISLTAPSPDLAANTSNFAQALATKVPSYMLPSIWLVIEAMPFLPSGKIDRKRLQRWLDDLSEQELQQCNFMNAEAFDTEAYDDTVMELCKVISQVLVVPTNEIDPRRSFIAQGGDSISAMRVHNALRSSALVVRVKRILTAPSLLELAQELKASQKIVTVKEAQAEVLMEEYGLSPIQSFYADLALGDDLLSQSTNANWNATFHFRLTRRLDQAVLQEAFAAVVQKHSLLRTRFSKDQQGQWRQRVTNDVNTSYQLNAYPASAETDISAILESSRTGLDIEAGPIIKADLVEDETGRQDLHLVMHHLVTDMMSWSILLEDMEAYIMKSGWTDQNPFSFLTWTQVQREDAERNWPPHKSLPYTVDQADLAYWGLEDLPNIDQESSATCVELPPDLLSHVRANVGVDEVDMNDILTAALSLAFSKNFPDRNNPTVYNLSHGRTVEDGIDTSRTIGWFSTFWPLQVPRISTQRPLDIVRKVTDTRKSIPLNGRAYFASRYHHPEGRLKFAGHENMEVTINHLGDFLGGHEKVRLFQSNGMPSRGSNGSSGPTKRLALFDLQSMVDESRLLVEFTYNTKAKHQDRILSWIKDLELTLLELAGYHDPLIGEC